MNNFNDFYMLSGGNGFSSRHGFMWARGGDFGGFDSFWGGFGPIGMFTLSIFFIIGLVLFLALVALKGYSLWTAAKRNEKWWFIALLLINTCGILELVYMIWFAKVWFQPKNKMHHNGTHHANGEHHDKSDEKNEPVQAEKL